LTGAGATWKARREEMEKSVEQVSAELRIAQRYIVGMEQGDFRGWPERVFSSGFIRTYAKFLGVEASPVLAEYERSMVQRAENGMAATLRPEWLERERERGSRRATYAVAAGVVLLVGIVLAWVSLRGIQRPWPVTPVIPVAPALPPAAKTPVGAADNLAGSADHVLPAPNAASAPLGGPPPEAASTVSTEGGGEAGPLTGPFQLFLEARELTWVMYDIDGGAPLEAMLYPGDKISIQAERTLDLKIGNAAGVVGTLNGRRLPPFGERGQVRKLTFGR
jgi:cytoskeleton protein RodZ